MSRKSLWVLLIVPLIGCQGAMQMEEIVQSDPEERVNESKNTSDGGVNETQAPSKGTDTSSGPKQKEEPGESNLVLTLSGPTSGRRLTTNELEAVVLDLLKTEVKPATHGLDPEGGVHGFRSNPKGQLISTVRSEAYFEYAVAVASAVEEDVLIKWSGGCSKAEMACATTFVERLGLVLERRPIEPARVQAQSARLIRHAKLPDESFVSATRVVLASLLQSPGFLYRLERRSDQGQPDAYAVLSRLSFLLWGSAPSRELLEQASSLNTSDQSARAALVDKMLNDSKFERGMRRFFEDWLHLHRLDAMTRSKDLFPDLTPELRQAMKGEAIDMLVAASTKPDGAVLDALLSYESPNGGVARLYGSEAKEMQKIQLQGLDDRRGLLTTPGILSVPVETDHASLVSRGEFILETLLCTTPPPPDPNISTDLPAGTEGLPERQRLEIHRTEPSCQGCHAAIDPFGYPFERFNALGEYVPQMEDGTPLPSHGEAIIDGKTASFESPRDFAELLHQSTRAQRCVVYKLWEHVAGREPLPKERKSLNLLTQNTQRHPKGQMHALLRAFALSDAVWQEVSP